MKNKALYVRASAFVVFMAIIAFTIIGCSGKSGRNFNDVEKVENWLASQKGGRSPDDPIPFSVKVNLQNMASAESNWQKLLTSINAAGLYVALDLSGCTMPNTEFNADGGITIGKEFIVSLILPDNTESVAGVLYRHFINLETVKAKNIEIFIGVIGPAGGFEFYDKGEYSDGWRYLEAAPTDMETSLRWVAQSYGDNWRFFPDIVGTGTEIGTGKKNTDLILAFDPDAPAAKACADYEFGGYSDWFLPSRDELDLMYRNLKVRGIGGFDNQWFWSSSQDDDDGAWGQNFGDGNFGNGYKGNGVNVRAIRAY